MAACYAASIRLRAGQLGINSISGFNSAILRAHATSISKLLETSLSIRSSPSSLFPSRFSDCRHISQLIQSNGKRLFLVDTLALVRRLEAQGVPSKQAEAITGAITEVLNVSLENVAQSFVSKGEMQKIEMIQESNLSKFMSKVQSSQSMPMACLRAGGSRILFSPHPGFCQVLLPLLTGNGRPFGLLQRRHRSYSLLSWGEYTGIVPTYFNRLVSKDRNRSG